MSGKDTPKDRRSEAEKREDRLKQALKANLARRKAQAKGRRGGGSVPAADNDMSRRDGEQEG